MDLVPLHGETTFSLTEAGGDGRFSFTIPKEIVEEAGGINNTEAFFSLMGNKNPLQEKILNLDLSGDNYQVTTILNDLQYGGVTLSLKFYDTSQNPKEELALCIHDVTLDINTRTISCNLNLRRRAILGGNIYAVLGVNVFDEAGNPIQGATITANDGSTDIALGMTGSGAFGTMGYLKSYLKKGNYMIRADLGSEYGNKSVELSPLQIKNIEVILNQKMEICINDCEESTSTHEVTLDLSAIQLEKITSYYVSENSASPLQNSNGWISISPSTFEFSQEVPFQLSEQSGEKTVYFWLKYESGDIYPKSSSVNGSILLDTPPTPLAISINQNSSYTPSLDVTVDISAKDDFGVTGYFLSESSTTPNAEASGWQQISSVLEYSQKLPYNLNVGDRTKEVYTWFQDTRGNVSQSIHGSITLDQTPPSENLSIQINGEQASTSTRNVYLSLSANDNFGVAKYYRSESSTPPTIGSNGWFDISPVQTPYQETVSYNLLSSGDGNKTVYAWFQDMAGNISQTTQGSIILDTTGPQNTTIRIIGGSSESLNVSFSISCSDINKVKEVYFSESSSTPSVQSSSWRSISPITPYSGNFSHFFQSDSPGTKTIYAWCMDTFNNISPRASDNINYTGEYLGHCGET